MRRETRPAVGSGAYQKYQVAKAGPTEVEVAGGGERVFADGIDGTDLVETKYVDAKKSPFVPGSGVPEFLQKKIDVDQRDEFRRYGAVLRDAGSGFKELRVVTNDDRAVAYFRKLMVDYNVPGRIAVEP